MKILLISGSVFGTATLVAEEIELALSQASHKVIRPDATTVESLTDESLDVLVVCTSTTGSGDVPDNLEPVFLGLQSEHPRITHLKCLVVALGDSSYENFAGAGVSMHEALLDLGAQMITEPLKIDALEVSEPEDLAPPWVIKQLDQYFQEA